MLTQTRQPSMPRVLAVSHVIPKHQVSNLKTKTAPNPVLSEIEKLTNIQFFVLPDIGQNVVAQEVIFCPRMIRNKSKTYTTNVAYELVNQSTRSCDKAYGI